MHFLLVIPEAMTVYDIIVYFIWLYFSKLWDNPKVCMLEFLQKGHIALLLLKVPSECEDGRKSVDSVDHWQ